MTKNFQGYYVIAITNLKKKEKREGKKNIGVKEKLFPFLYRQKRGKSLKKCQGGKNFTSERSWD